MTFGVDGDGALIRQVHKAVIAAGKTRSGCTVHQVTEEVDSGPIVVQKEVEVTPEETPETLKTKVNHGMYGLHSPPPHTYAYMGSCLNPKYIITCTCRRERGDGERGTRGGEGGSFRDWVPLHHVEF